MRSFSIKQPSPAERKSSYSKDFLKDQQCEDKELMYNNSETILPPSSGC